MGYLGTIVGLAASGIVLSNMAAAQPIDPQVLLAGKSCVGKVTTGFKDHPDANMSGWFIQWTPQLDGKLWRASGLAGYENPPQVSGTGTAEVLSKVRSTPSGEIVFHRSSDQDVYLTPAGNGGFSIRTATSARYSRVATGSMTCK